MSFLIQVANGFAFGIGLVLASLVMKLVFKIGFCG